MTVKEIFKPIMISANAVAVRLDSSNPKGALNMCLYPSAYIKKIVDDIDGSMYVSTLQLLNSGVISISVLLERTIKLVDIRNEFFIIVED